MRRRRAKQISRNPFVRFQSGFEAGFTRFRNGYVRLLTFCVDFAGVFLIVFLVFAVGSVALLVPWLGQDFFPDSRCRAVQDSRARAYGHAD